MHKNLRICFVAAVFAVGFFVFSPHAHAADVFYSVGQSTADLKTGTPTITITSGAVTFSEAQTGNIGVGDRVTYGQLDISTFADQGGGLVRITTSASHGFATGDYVNISGTTNYNGTYQIANAATNVFDITHTYTAEAGGTTKYVANIAYIASKNTTSIWNLTSPIGTAISNRASAVTVNSIKHEYTTLNSAITGAKDANHINNTDLTAANVVLNIPCYYDSAADMTAVSVTGYTTGLSNYIKIYTPVSTSTEANNSQRHQGRWDEGKYRLEITAAVNYTYPIGIGEDFVKIDGLQILLNGQNYSWCYDITASNINAGAKIYIANNIIKAANLSGTPQTAARGISFNDGDGTYFVWNNVLYDFNGIGTVWNSTAVSFDATSNIYAYNNTAYNCNRGFFRNNTVGGTFYAKNNIAQNCVDGYYGTFDGSSSNNISDLANDIQQGTNNKNSTTVSFADAANKDFHLSPSDTAAKNAGADLSSDANLPVTTDIDGQTRPAGINANDIGADEAATAVYFSVGQNTDDHKTGSPTVTISSGTATFSEAQTATNMGVGDKVTYDGSTVVYITRKISQTQWEVTNAIGEIPLDQSNRTVNSIAHAFDSLSDAEAGAPTLLGTSDLVTNNYQLNIPCYYDSGPDTTAVVVDGYSTSLSNHIKIYTLNNTTTEVNQSQRHQGKWDDGKYKLYTTADTWTGLIYVLDDNVRMEGLQIENAGNADSSNPVGIRVDQGNDIRIASNMVKFTGSGTVAVTNEFGIDLDYISNNSKVLIYNNIVSNFGVGIFYDYAGSGVDFTVYNNTVHNNLRGIHIQDNASDVSLKLVNNLSSNNSSQDFIISSFTNYTHANNLSLDATSPDSSYRNKTVSFSDSTNKDFHLSPSDTVAKNAGASLYNDPNFAFTSDIDGHQRSSASSPQGSEIWDIGADEAATAIYYSVGQNTDSHETGSGTVTVDATARTATFSVAQTATNMGVGDKVTYTGGSCYITSKTSTSVWGCQSATGGSPTAATGADVTSIAHAFASLDAAVTGASGASYLNTSDLVTNNYQLNIPCYYDSGPDTTAVSVTGYTTGVSNYIKIYTPYNTTTEANQSQRHQGKWDDGRFNLVVSASNASVLNISANHVQIVGLQVKQSANDRPSGIYVPTHTTAENKIEIVGNIVRGPNTAQLDYTAGSAGIKLTGDRTNVYVSNNIVYDFNSLDSDAGIGIYCASPNTNHYIYNNTLLNNKYGIATSYRWITVNIKNNLVQNSVTADYYSVGIAPTIISSNNISKDNTSWDSGYRNQTVSFADATNKDFHLSPSDTAAKNQGTSLASDSALAFNTDIDNQTRPNGSAWDIGADEAANNVFYSVGQSTADLKTGTPTVTITSGAAVFSAAQTGNIGVGDRVTYNTSSIAYIAAKTNADMMHWTLVTATGGVPADITTSTVVSIKHEYTTLNSAIVGASDANHINNTDLTTANVVLNIPCYYDSGADTTAVSVTGYTTGPSNYIKIYTPVSTSTEANNSQRHQGKWDDGKFNLSWDSGYQGLGWMLIRNRNVVVDGLQIRDNQTTYGQSLICNYNGNVTNGFVKISNNIIRGNISNNIGQTGINDDDNIESNVQSFIYNNIIYDEAGYGIYSLAYKSGGGVNGKVVIYNNTLYNNGRRGAGYQNMRVQSYASGRYCVVKNNIAYTASGSTDYSPATPDEHSNNISKDATSWDTSFRNKTVQFADLAGKDFHLDPSDTAAKNAGADLSAEANFAFNTDIDGHTRPSSSCTAWDIGADEAATAVYYSVGQNTNDHKTGTSPTLTISSGIATFSEAQTATNMGVGDKVTYNTTSVAYISEKISTTQWKLITATGATPADVGTAQTVNSISHPFASLSAAVGNTNPGASGASYLNTRNLYTGNYQLNIPCYYDSGPDTTTVTINNAGESGWTTVTSNFIKIYTPNNISTEANQSQRASGKWDDTKYRLEKSAAVDYARNILNRVDNLHVDGLQFKITNNDYNDCESIYADDSWYPNRIHDRSAEMKISNSIIWGVSSTTNNDKIHGITGASRGTIHAWNNIIYGFNLNSSVKSKGITISRGYVYNNTFFDNTRGIETRGSATSPVIVKNNIVQNSVDGFVSDMGTFDAASDYNISDLAADAPGSHSKNSTTVAFADEANYDFHLSNTDTAARGAGVNLQADAYLHFSQDIDGQERTGFWDIGADQFFNGQLQSQISSPNLDSGLVGHWTFNGEDIDGTTAKDISGNNNNGTNNGATSVTGKLGQGMGLDGNNDLVSLPAGMLNGKNKVTLSGWIYVNSFPNTVQSLWDICGSVNWQHMQWLRLDSDRVIVYTGTDSEGNQTSANTSDYLKRWTHFAVTTDYQTGDVYVYQDGVQIAHENKTYNNTSIISSNFATIGYTNGNAVSLDGKADDIRIYDRVLSAAEISTLYHLGQDTVAASEASKGNTNGLVGYWSFDGPTISGTTVNDLSGQNNHGTITGAVPALGKLGQGMGFDGADDGVNVGDINTVDGQSYLTVSAWVKQDALDTTNGRVVASKYNNWGENFRMLVRDGNGGDDIMLAMDFTNYGRVSDIHKAGEWEHWTMVFDGSQTDNANRLKFFFNGVQQTLSFGGTIPATTASTAYGLCIGGDGYNGAACANSNKFWNGSIDDVRIYNRALTAGEVQQIYNIGKVNIRK